jgi:sugar (pentulose or hexulose) kinase
VGLAAAFWLQIKADVLQKPVTGVESEETACLGAALMAAVSGVLFPAWQKA